MLFKHYWMYEDILVCSMWKMSKKKTNNSLLVLVVLEDQEIPEKFQRHRLSFYIRLYNSFIISHTA